MKKYFIISIVSLLALASCTVQEILLQEVEPVETQDVYHAGFGENTATKTAVDAQGRLYWENGDMISIFRSTANQPYVYEGETGARMADFVRASDDFYAGQDIPTAIAVYPYDMDTAVTDDGSGVYVTFSSNQQYAEGSFGHGAAPMVAFTKDIKDKDLNFKNLAGYLVIPAYGNTTVKKIEFTDNSGSMLNLTYLVDAVYGQDPVIHQANYIQAYQITLDCTRNPVKLTNDKFTEFWFALPPMTLEAGFTVKFYTADGEFEFCTFNSRTITRNIVNRMVPVSVSTSDAPWEYFTDPSTGEPMVFTFTQKWWQETAEGYIKYRTIGSIRHCVTETFQHHGNYGFWGMDDTPEDAVEWNFLWHTDTDALELPSQYTGFYHSNYESSLVVVDHYHYLTDIKGQALADWDYCYNNYDHGYYDGNGGFYLYVYGYILVDYGAGNAGWGIYDYDNVLEAQTYFDRREYWVNIWDGNQDGADKPIYFETGRTVSRLWYTVVEGYVDGSQISDIAASIYGDDGLGIGVDVTGQYAEITVTPGRTGEYTLVAITDGGEYSFIHFSYVNPDEAPLELSISVTPGYDPARAIDYVIKGEGITEAYSMVVLTECVPEDLKSWMNSYNKFADYAVSSINGDGYYSSLEGLCPGRSYTMLVYAGNGVNNDVFTVEFVTGSLDYEPVATGVYELSIWWDAQQTVELCRDPSVENGFVITNWGDHRVDFPFIWNEDNTLTVPVFQIGAVQSTFGPVYYCESRDYYAGFGYDETDSRMQPSYYEDGVFYFHVAMVVSAGTYGDFWETFTLNN